MLCAILAVFAVWVSLRKSSTEARCVRAGYPSYKVTYVFDRYCVKRVNQTDVVVTLGAAESGASR